MPCQSQTVKEDTTGQNKQPINNWNTYDGNMVFFYAGVGLFLDTQRYIQDENNIKQVGSMTEFEQAQIRAIRFLFSGILKLHVPISLYADIGYLALDQGFERNKDPQWSIYNLELKFSFGEIGNLTIGRMKEPVSLDRTVGGHNLPFMERFAGINAILPSRNDGIKWSNTFLADRLTGALGWFNTWLVTGDNFSKSSKQFSGRVTYLPLLDREENHLLHLGIYGKFSNNSSGFTRFRASPEAYYSPTFIDTDTIITSGYTNWIGAEVSWRGGPLWIGAEYVQNNVSSQLSGNPAFNTYQIFVEMIITGETRPYLYKRGSFAAGSPEKDVTQGGTGLWAVAAHYTRTDMTSGLIRGGDLDQFTAALSWYAIAGMRTVLQYSLARLDRFDLVGWVHMFMLRFQALL